MEMGRPIDFLEASKKFSRNFDKKNSKENDETSEQNKPLILPDEF